MKNIIILLTLIFITQSVKAAYNFSVVVENEDFQIYRSSALGSSGLKYVKNALEEKNLPFPKTIVYMNDAGYGENGFAIQERNLQDDYGFTFYESKGYGKTYLDGHDPRYPDKDIDRDGKIDGDIESFYRILEIVLKKENQPVLFHCLGGRHRTGMIAMAIRYMQEGKWINGPKRRRFVLPRMRSPLLNPAESEYVDHNRELFRFTNVRFIRSESKTPRFIALKNEFKEELNGNSSYCWSCSQNGNHDHVGDIIRQSQSKRAE